MFYEKQPLKQQLAYKELLKSIGSLSKLYSANNSPYLDYRNHENVFCKSFEAQNLARRDCSIDAKKGQIGIGLKTWVGSDNQKVAEFNKLRSQYKNLKGIDLVKQIAKYRNTRIQTTKAMYGVSQLIYHIIKRESNKMIVFEHPFEPIDIDAIELMEDKGNDSNIYFTDHKFVYHFSVSKSTLYMNFDFLEKCDEIDVDMYSDPYALLLGLQRRTVEEIELITSNNQLPLEEESEDLTDKTNDFEEFNSLNQICLRLYSVARGEKFVPKKSGLNQWNAGGRKRDPNELYIPFPSADRKKNQGFFPGRDTIFDLKLPDETVIKAKICQDDGKAIMSNPNKVLGEWLLRKVFELPEGTVVTYEMLEVFGIDSVIITKEKELFYSIDFSALGSYEKFYE